MMKFLARLLVFLIIAAGAAYLLFPIASDQYMLYQNELLLRVYEQRVSGLNPARVAVARHPVTDWNNRQIQEGIIEDESFADGEGIPPFLKEGELARLAEKLGAEPPKQRKDRMDLLLSPKEEGLTPPVVQALIRKFRRANGTIQPLRVEDPFTAKTDSASSLLFTDRNGTIGILEIPKIGVMLPVYNKRTQDHLETGLFWGSGSSLPNGGGGTHTMLAGSGGLPAPGVLNDLYLTGPKMLQDMDKLQQGDLILYSSMGQTMVYQIERIAAAPANQTIILERSISEDKMTVVSAPRNGGRLIVQGTRIDPAENRETMLADNAASLPPDWVTILTLGAPVMVLGLAVMFIVERIKHRRYRLPTEI